MFSHLRRAGARLFCLASGALAQTGRPPVSSADEHTIAIIGRRRSAGMVDTVVLDTQSNDPDDTVRRELARTFKLGLTRFVARSPLDPRLQVTCASSLGQRQQAGAANLKDRGNVWTDLSNVNAVVRAEEQQRSLNGSLCNTIVNQRLSSLGSSGGRFSFFDF